MFLFKKKEKTFSVLREFDATVYGVNDEPARQTAIAGCKVGDELTIKPAPTDDYPLNFGVFKRNQQLGVISPKVLRDLMTVYAGRNLSAAVNAITPGRRGNDCKIHIVVYDNPPTSKGYTVEEWNAIVADNEIVYVVKGGSVYHSDESCVNKDATKMATKKARAAGFTPCKKCCKG